MHAYKLLFQLLARFPHKLLGSSETMMQKELTCLLPHDLDWLKLVFFSQAGSTFHFFVPLKMLYTYTQAAAISWMWCLMHHSTLYITCKPLHGTNTASTPIPKDVCSVYFILQSNHPIPFWYFPDVLTDWRLTWAQIWVREVLLCRRANPAVHSSLQMSFLMEVMFWSQQKSGICLLTVQLPHPLQLVSTLIKQTLCETKFSFHEQFSRKWWRDILKIADCKQPGRLKKHFIHHNSVTLFFKLRLHQRHVFLCFYNQCFNRKWVRVAPCCVSQDDLINL